MRLAAILIMQSLILLPGAMQDRSTPARSTAPAAAQSLRVINTLSVGGEGGWDYLAIDPDARRLYVPRSTRVMVLDADSGASVGEIPDTSGVHGVALATALNKGFTSNGRAGTITVFDLKSLKVIQTVKAGENPDAILFEPVTKRVFAFNGRSKDATVIDADNLAVAGTIELGGKPEFAVADGAGKVFVNIEDTSELVRLDAHSLNVEKRYPLAPGEEPSGLAIDPAHHRLFAVCANQKMVILDSESGHVLASPEIGKGVDGAAFDPSSACAFSSNGEGTMTVVATAEGPSQFKTAQTVPTAARARTIVLDPKTHHLYLPTADFEAATSQPEGGRSRPAMKPGTFRILVVGT